MTEHERLAKDLENAKNDLRCAPVSEREWREAEIDWLKSEVRATDPRFYHPTFFADQY